MMLSACSTQHQTYSQQSKADIPANWHQQSQALVVEDNWLQEFKQPFLFKLVQQALTHNQNLLQQAYQLEIEEQRVIVSGATLLPSLDLSVRNSRTKSATPTTYATTSSASLNLAYEVDIWGKLSASQRQANLSYLAQKSSFEQAKQQLVADVVIAWFNSLSAQQLEALYQARVHNAEQNLDIIEQGYQQGLNAALDVYLARNNLHSERSRLTQQQASSLQSSRVLERLLGKYPKGQVPLSAKIPLLENTIPQGLPSELVTRKPELVASWYQLLAKDAALAYAHKQRFPSLNLSASLSDSGEKLSDVFSPSSLAWSLIGSISAPIFNNGKLKANENIAKLTLKQGEQQYLDTLYSAFNSVETAISQESSLAARYQATLAARDNAVIAEQLAFEQYKTGLVTYTTVLDAQGRSFDAQSSLIELKNQLISNRVNLHVALGGDFSAANNITSDQ
ncbi:RND transporter [Paraglaciecola hydrolytica]|uniref:RND transporter n=2 Tax=Paraglaciecola hydrolytica TaxID=1799789 RepID=A0A136A5M4_9ALTE|nr:RND transporter [Paraglaciecola hydrolytica]